MDRMNEAQQLDLEFMKDSLKDDFNMPYAKDGKPFVYVCGNSLGPQPKLFDDIIKAESTVWSRNAVNGHLDNPSGKNWADLDSALLEDFKCLVGAHSLTEVAINSTLTTNLHNLMIHFYKPTKERYKIVIDSMSFPSDYYAVEAQIRLHGFDPKDALIEIEPRDPVERTIEEEDVISVIKEHGSTVALIMFSGVQYLTGQQFELKKISKAARDVGALVSFDLAHAIGNVPINLEEIDVDFAVWCTYKYLNAGPGSVGGFYVNRRHHERISQGKGPILAGWWGVDFSKRFLMKHEFEPYEGARAFQQSCTSVFNTCGLIASLETFKKMSVSSIRERSFVLTQYFRKLFEQDGYLRGNIKIITPQDLHRSGAQISLAFPCREATIEAFNELTRIGIVLDRREPDILRLTFTGLYNSHCDVYATIEGLKAFRR